MSLRRAIDIYSEFKLILIDNTRFCGILRICQSSLTLETIKPARAKSMVGRPTACTLHHLTCQEKMFALLLLLVVLLLVSILLAVESCIPFKMPELKRREGFSKIGMDSYRSYTKKSKARLKALREKN